MGREQLGKVELQNFNEENFIQQFYAYRRDNYPGSKNMRQVLVAFLAISPWRQEGKGVVEYLDFLLRSKNSKKGWDRRKEEEQKAREKIPLLVKAKPARVSREQKAEIRGKRKAKAAAEKIAKEKTSAAIADFRSRQGSLI